MQHPTVRQWTKYLKSQNKLKTVIHSIILYRHVEI